MTRPGRKLACLLLVGAFGAAGVGLWFATTTAPGENADAPLPVASPLRPADPERVRTAVERGLRHLRASQDPRTGGWIQDVGYKRGPNYIITANERPHVGVSALALMAMLAGGHLPGRGEHGSVVARGTDFILSCVDDSNGFISAHNTRMYSHAFSTLFLTQIFGMTHREDVREKLQLAVDLTVESQSPLGGWRYAPNSPRADMSITVCQIMALRAARNVGIRVPKSTIDRAYRYVDGSALKRRGRNYGGFRYKIEIRQSRTTFPLTAAGVATLNHSGIYEHELINAGISYLKSNLSGFNRSNRSHYFYWYGHYYASQVFFLTSDDDDSLWSWYWKRMSPELVTLQKPDGSWSNPTGPGSAFATAIACIILQIPFQHLPIFHR